jgi:glucokinase
MKNTNPNDFNVGYVVGIDLGATKIALSMVGPDNTLITSRRFSTDSHLGLPSACQRIHQAIASMEDEVGQKAQAVGICTPGPVDFYTGMLLDPPNLDRSWHHQPFRPMLSDELGVPVSLEHDAKAAGLGEFYFGAGRANPKRDMVFIILGTGVGAAILVNGNVLRGRTNSAGELGHITIDRHGAPGTAGVVGNVEQFCAGPALVRGYAVRTGQTVDGAHITQLAQQGAPDALAVFADAGDALAAGIGTAAQLLDIDLYVLGGSVARTGEVLLKPTRTALHKYAHPSIVKRIEVVTTTLFEEGAILGCAWQARVLFRTGV